MTRHPSMLELDRFFLGACNETEGRSLKEHLGACAPCRQSLEEMARDQWHFRMHLAERSERALAARMSVEAPPVSSFRRWWGSLTLVGFAAAALLFWARPWQLGLSHEAEGGPATLATKGGPHLVLVVKRGQRVVRLAPKDTRVQPGDEVRFLVSPPPRAGQHVQVVSIDLAGTASTYFTAVVGSKPLDVADGAWRLPGSIVLDETLGPERIFVIVSDRAPAAATVRESLRAIGRGGADGIRNSSTLAGVPGEQASFLIEKVSVVQNSAETATPSPNSSQRRTTPALVSPTGALEDNRGERPTNTWDQTR